MNNYQVNSAGRIFSLTSGMKRAKAILPAILLCLFSLLSLHLLASWQQPTVAATSAALSEQAAPEMGNDVATNDVDLMTTFAEASANSAPPRLGKGEWARGRKGERWTTHPLPKGTL